MIRRFLPNTFLPAKKRFVADAPSSGRLIRRKVITTVAANIHSARNPSAAARK